MNFKRYKELKARAIASLQQEESLKKSSSSPELEDSLMLAYIGDVVYSLYIRNQIVTTGITKMQVLHDIVTEFICAKAQAKAFLAIESQLTEEETLIAKRARNSNVNVPKSASVQEYRLSTALEALLGYWYRKGDETRLKEMMNAIYRHTLQEL